MEMESGNCEVCGLETSKRCAQCKKVHYCSKEHQVAHRREHKDDCYPAEIKYDESMGYYLVATKDIPAGYFIFKEKPLLLSPNGNLKNLKKICVSCCDLVKDCNTCSKCGWPVCDSECENAYQHAKFECPILVNSDIPRPKDPHEFELVTLIRCVLLKSLKPDKWDKLMTMLPRVGARFTRKNITRLHYNVETAYQIITELCKIQDTDIDTMEKICGIINATTYNSGRLANETGLQLYYKGSKVIPGCIPNVRVFDVEPDLGGCNYNYGKVQRTPHFQIRLMATVEIKKGEILQKYFTDSVLATSERQSFLKDAYDYACFCKRCTDPTEFNTYVSAIRCSSPKCKDKKDENLGFFLPIDGTDEHALWKCNRCQYTVPYYDDVYDLAVKVSEIVDTAMAQLKIFEDLPNGSGVSKAVMYLDNVIKHHNGVLAHKNHYLLFPIKIQFLAQMYSFLADVQNETNLHAVMSNRMSEVAGELLKLANKIFPGVTLIRGRFLFYLTTSRWHTMKWNMNKGKDYFKYLPAVQDLSKLKNLSQEILSLEPVESIENAMASALSNIDLFSSKYSDNLLKQEMVRLRRT